jgi:hypothetical protein
MTPKFGGKRSERKLLERVRPIETRSIVEILEQRMKDAQQAFHDVLEQDFLLSLTLSPEETMRRHVEALRAITADEPV